MRLREQKLRDLGGLSLEMYRRDRFREDLLLERCAELIGARGPDPRARRAPRRRESRAGRPEDGQMRVRCAAAVGLPFLRHVRAPGRQRAGERAMSDAGQARCPRCNATVQPGQEYCLECGNRLVQEPAGPVARASTIGRRATRLGRHMARAGAARSRDRRARHRCRDRDLRRRRRGNGDPDRDGGSLTVTGGTPTLTAPEPTTAPRAATTAPTPTTTPPRPRPNPAAITWPAGERGWTIVLVSLPQANGRDAAAAQAKKARDGGLRRVGILDSSRYASLHPGYYVVFQGVYDDEAEASSALQRARAVFPSAYQREIVP